MRDHRQARRWIAWGLVSVPVGAFVGLFFGGNSGAMFIATYVLAHLPFMGAVTWAVFRWESPWRATFVGWVAWVFSAGLWEALYHALYRRFGWGAPDLPGELLFGLVGGWIPALFTAGLAAVAKLAVDKHLPLSSPE